MLSLEARINLLESDLLADPPRVSSYRELPFAILRYDPTPERHNEGEWRVRRALRLLASRLEQRGKRARFLSLSKLLWRGVEETEGLEALEQLERERGFQAAHAQLHRILSHEELAPLPELLAEELSRLDPKTDIAFLTRAAAFAPAIYPMSQLLDQMQGRTRVTTILLYPGSLEGGMSLRFMDIPGREAVGNYRVKIYS